MSGNRTSPTLLEQLRDPKQSEAWSTFEGTYRDLVHRYCLRRGLQHADAEDAWQQTLVSLMRALPAFSYDRGRGRFRAYLFVVVRSVLATLHERRIRAPQGASIDISAIDEAALVAPGDVYDAAWECEWRSFHFRRAWESLASEFEPRSLEAFEALLEGRSIRDVAASLSMSEAALHKVKQRVRQRLQECIEAQVALEDGAV